MATRVSDNRPTVNPRSLFFIALGLAAPARSIVFPSLEIDLLLLGLVIVTGQIWRKRSLPKRALNLVPAVYRKPHHVALIAFMILCTAALIDGIFLAGRVGLWAHVWAFAVTLVCIAESWHHIAVKHGDKR
jgi:hypothetical protein